MTEAKKRKTVPAKETAPKAETVAKTAETKSELPPMCTSAGHRLFPVPSLTAEDAKYMRSYSCRGIDNGLLNNYVLDGVYDFVVERVLPGWLAPNVLTLAGPVPALVVAALCLLLPREYTDPSATHAVWRVLNVCGALAIFWFLLMDNVDGKHARHIHWCSPLGDWLDHALDIASYVSIVTSFCLLSGLGTTAAWIFDGITVFTYTLVIWEAQLCGELIIHKVESCSEGMFLFACMHIVYCILGDPSPVFQKVLFVLPDTERLAALGLNGQPVTVFIAFASIEILVAAGSLFTVLGVVIRLSKKEPLLRVLSAVLGALVPAAVSFGSSALFFVRHPEAAAAHPAANILQLACPSIFAIYICNLCRLLGWRFSLVETFTRPQPVLFALLPWVLRLAFPHVAPGTVLVVSAACSCVSLVFWFFAVTIALKNMLGMPLLHVRRPAVKSN